MVDEGSAYEPTGQKVFDFGLGDSLEDGRRPGVLGTAAARPPAEAAAKPHPAALTAGAASAPVTARSAYDWFVEGTRAEIVGGDEADAPRRAVLPRGDGARSRAGRGAHQPRQPRLPARRHAAAAREAFEAALALDPDQPEARFNLANLVLEAGDLELAVAELRRVLQATPDFADAHYNLAVALERLGGRAQARAHLEHYLALEPATTAWAAEARALIERLDA